MEILVILTLQKWTGNIKKGNAKLISAIVHSVLYHPPPGGGGGVAGLIGTAFEVLACHADVL